MPLIDLVGMSIREALPIVADLRDAAGLHYRIRLVASGKLVNRLLHINRDSQDLLNKLEAIRLLCREVGCAQRYLTQDAFNAIYQATRGIEYDGLDRAVDLCVARLRKKIGDDARNPERIKSVRGVGYLFATPASGVRE